MQTIEPIYSPFPAHIEKKELDVLTNLLQCSPVSIISTKYKGKSNIMAASKLMHISTQPPFIAVAIEQSRFSLDIIKSSEEFAINIPTITLLHYVEYLGHYSGEQMDKINFLQLETFTPVSITAPLLKNCCAWIEMEVHDINKVGNHELVIGYPKMIFVDPQSFTNQWILGPIDRRPMIYLNDNRYSPLGKAFEARLPIGGDNHYKKLQEQTKEHIASIHEEEEKLQEKMGQIRRELGTDLIADMAEAIINEELNDE
ncbi:MAG: flavin reductase family protein [Dehalococcoidia bacterium]|nr:flavin reductase family protein [Dehalococcoidia bacterium]